jgi:hypothetical protein
MERGKVSRTFNPPGATSGVHAIVMRELAQPGCKPCACNTVDPDAAPEDPGLAPAAVRGVLGIVIAVVYALAFVLVYVV